jgi:hypothetical protein
MGSWKEAAEEEFDEGVLDWSATAEARREFDPEDQVGIYSML